jgi:hypothetical protein
MRASIDSPGKKVIATGVSGAIRLAASCSAERSLAVISSE